MAKKKPPAYLFKGPNFNKPPSPVVPKPTPKPKTKAKVGPYTKGYKKPPPKPTTPRPVVPSSGPYVGSSPTPTPRRKVVVKPHTREHPTRHLKDITADQWGKLTPRQKMNVRGADGKPIGFAGASKLERLTQQYRDLHRPGVPSATQAGPALTGEAKRRSDEYNRKLTEAARQMSIESGVAQSGALGLIGASARIGDSLPVKYAGQIGEGLAGIPMGFAQYYKALGTDAWNAAHGDLRATQSRGLVTGMAKGLYYQVTHPVEQGGALLFTAGSLLAGGAGAVSKLGIGARAAAGAEGSLAAKVMTGIRTARVPHYAELKANALRLDVPLSENVLARPLQKAKVARQNVGLKQGGAGPRMDVVKELSPASRVGRVLRNQGQIKAELGQIPARNAARALKWETQRTSIRGRIFHHTDSGRGQAIGIVGIFGDEALVSPLASVKMFVETHKQLQREAWNDYAIARSEGNKAGMKQAKKDVKAQQEILDASPSALHYLETQPQEFLDALDGARQLSWAADRELQARGVLPGERAHGRLTNIYNFYRGARFTRPSLGKLIEGKMRPEDLVGQRVVAHDRNNIGTVRSVDTNEGVAWVDFHNKRTGARGEAYLSLDDIHLHNKGPGKFVFTTDANVASQQLVANLAKQQGEARRVAGGHPGDPQAPLALIREREQILRGREAEGPDRWATASDAEIEARIAEIQGRWDTLVDKIEARNTEGKFGPLDPKAAQDQINLNTKRRKRKGLAKAKTVGSTLRDAAEQEAWELVNRRPELHAIRDQVEEIAVLQRLLESRHPVFGEELPAAQRPLPTEAAPEPPPLAEAPPEGSFFFSTAPKYRRGVSRVKTGAPTGPRPGEFGVGPPSPSAQVTGLGRRVWTGESMKHGFPMIAGSVVDHFMGAMRLASLFDTYEALSKAGVKRRTSLDQVGVREMSAITDELRDAMSNVVKDWEEHPPMEKDVIPSSIMDRLHEILAGDMSEVPVGGTEDGVVWVDKDFIKTFPGGDAGVWGIVKFVNNTARFGQLYLRPAYILNWLGNAIMGAGTMGATEPWHYYQGYRGRAKYGAEVDDLVTTMAGESRTESYLSRSGRVRKGQEKVAEGWNAVTDLAYRKANVYYWASRHGYYGKEGLLRLAEKDANGHYVHEQDIINITNRARNDAVNFSNLTPFERETLKNIIYFYPWTSRATVWTGRFIVEHPVKSAIAYQIGEQGSQETKRLVGELADWAAHGGIFPVGDTSGKNIQTINPASVFTPLTAVQSAYDVKDLVQGLATGVSSGDFRRSQTPFLQLFAGLMGANLYGRPGGVLGLAEQQPIVAALSRAGIIPAKQGKTYPGGDFQDVWGSLLGGGLVPRTTSKEAIQAKPPTPTAKEKESKKIAHWEKVLGRKAIPLVRKASAQKITYERLQKTLKDKLGVDKLTDAQRGLIKLRIFDSEERPPKAMVDKLEEMLKSENPYAIGVATGAIERHLHWDVYDAWSREVNRREKTAKAKKAQAKRKPHKETQAEWDAHFKVTG